MREVPLSISEYDFVIKALSENLVCISIWWHHMQLMIWKIFLKRLDKRGVYDNRDIDIKFLPSTSGGVIVSLGNTKYNTWSWWLILLILI